MQSPAACRGRLRRLPCLPCSGLTQHVVRPHGFTLGGHAHCCFGQSRALRWQDSWASQCCVVRRRKAQSQRFSGPWRPPCRCLSYPPTPGPHPSRTSLNSLCFRPLKGSRQISGHRLDLVCFKKRYLPACHALNSSRCSFFPSIQSRRLVGSAASAAVPCGGLHLVSTLSFPTTDPHLNNTLATGHPHT
ncbi:hypothetical protein BS50DRAFT_349946 [Corynespora cassiicola Philippines]|uniref:Uncharacterized protein n=1 Tax=Corynespora cassiicola Philippines TaxID=1448308 RepID=A0A2T2NRW0_CORCC|nr:hypothetical protein BS50DRAFT_349946 [Corynespora cassiicola Philippines]